MIKFAECFFGKLDHKIRQTGSPRLDRQVGRTGKVETVPTLRSGPLHLILYVCVDGEVRVRGAFIRQTGFGKLVFGKLVFGKLVLYHPVCQKNRQTGSSNSANWIRQTGIRQTGPIPSVAPCVILSKLGSFCRNLSHFCHKSSHFVE